MALQYSIISALIRPEIKEKISVGLIVFDEQDTYFGYSKDKLNVARELLSENSFKIVRDVLKNIEFKLNSDKLNYSNIRGFKFFKNSEFDKNLSSEYMSYMSKYSNNSLLFSEPKFIDLQPIQESFNTLFSLYISSINTKEIDLKIKLKPFDLMKTKYKEKIVQMFDIKEEVTHEVVPNLITPITIDFCGRNGIDVFVQTLDMEQPINHISNHINGFFQLKSAYSQNKEKMKDFIIGNEPPKELVKQHDIWNQIRKQKTFDYHDVSESEKVIEYAEKKGVKPLSSVIK